MTACEHTQSPIVDVFFHHLYRSAAEPLPDDVHCQDSDLLINDLITEDHHQHDPEADVLYEAMQLVPHFAKPPTSSTQSSSLAVQQSSKVAVQHSVHSHLVKQLHDSYTAMDAFDLDIFTSVMGEQIIGLPMCYLAHESLAKLCWLFTSVWNNTYSKMCRSAGNCPNFSTFQKCYVLSANNATWDGMVQYALQYQDCCLYWSCRWFSWHDSDALCVIIDRLDSAKFSWPMAPWRISKKDTPPWRMSNLVPNVAGPRPRSALTYRLASVSARMQHFSDLLSQSLHV